MEKEFEEKVSQRMDQTSRRRQRELMSLRHATLRSCRARWTE